MRRQFGETLERYSKITKEELKPKSERIDPKVDLQQALDWEIAQERQYSKTPKQSQEQIVELQRRKQRVMRWLKRELAVLDDPDGKPEHSSNAITVEQEGDVFYYNDNRASKGQQRKGMTLGDLLTDGDWGNVYFLNPATVSYSVRKQFLIEEAKRRIWELFDKQVFIEEETSERTPDRPKEILGKMRQERESGVEKSGHILERIVRNYFRKMAINHELPFEVMPADTHQDVRQAIDFILHRDMRHRGVGVNEEDRADIGIQLTSNVDPEVLAKKHNVISHALRRMDERDPVADIVLVAMPFKESAGRLLSRWKNEGRPPGGPDRYWDSDTKIELFYKVLDGFATQQELREWSKQVHQRQSS